MVTTKQRRRFAAKLVVARRKLRLSQEEMARRCGVSSATVSRWERAVHEPDRLARIKLSEVFGRPVERVAGIRAADWAE